MADDWYRRKTWTPDDRKEFFARLQRSRAYSRPQYVQIQACSLRVVQTPEAYVAALELLDLFLIEWPEDSSLALVYDERARCFQGLGEMPRAVEAFRLAFDAQRARTNVLTTASLGFGWLAVTIPLPELYDEALAVMNEFVRNAFPIERYKTNAIRALIAEDRGAVEQARDCAREALTEAAAQHSGFRYHAKLGLVNSPDQNVHKRLERLASLEL